MIGGINGMLAYATRDAQRVGSVGSRDYANRARGSVRPDRVNGNVTPLREIAQGDPASASASVSITERSERSSKDEKTPPGQYSEAERREIERLKARDREVRAHENAHKAAAGQHAKGGPNYEYTSGPDGKQYATSGSVSIDTSEVPDDPEATVIKMEQVRRAALAPAEPSSQDARVAADASQKAAQARREAFQEKREEREGERQGVPEIAKNAYMRPERTPRIDIRA